MYLRCYYLVHLWHGDFNDVLLMFGISFVNFSHWWHQYFAEMGSSGYVDTLAARFYNKFLGAFDINLDLAFDWSAIWVVAEELNYILIFIFLHHDDMVVDEHNLANVWLGDARDVTQAVFFILRVFENMDGVHTYHTQKLNIFLQPEGHDFVFFCFFWNFEAFNFL